MMVASSEPDRGANSAEPYSSPFLPTATVAIIGLGLIGGSLALALRGRCAWLLGVDQDPAVVSFALARQVVDNATTDPSALIPQADLILIAVPVLSSIDLIHRLPELHPGQAVVMDMGSTKYEVIQAMSALPDRFDPLGGHPMCGKENGTLANAEAGLFQDATFALVPLPRSSTHSRNIALELVGAVGSHPLWLEPGEHDRWVAATSHLPHLLAAALALSTPQECAPLIGPGFRSTSRLAAGSAEMKTDIFTSNRQEVLDALARYRRNLDTLSDALQLGDLESLHQLLALSAERRQALLEETDGANG